MAWELAATMFPEGTTLVGDNCSIDDLAQYEMVRTARQFMARHMVIALEEIVWCSNGDMVRNRPYEVQPNDAPDNCSCLSVFGNKMVLDYLWKHKDSTYGGCENDGFNYTGLQ